MTNVVILLAAMVPLGLLRGFVIATLWGWFVVPTFHLVSLTIPVAIGMGLLVGLYQSAPKSDDEPVVPALLRGAIYPVVALAIGAFWQLFV